MGFSRHFKKRKPQAPAPKQAATAPSTQLEVEDESQESESEEQLQTLAGQPSSDVTLAPGKVTPQGGDRQDESQESESEQEDSPFDDAGAKVDDLSDFVPPTEKEIAAAAAKAKRPRRGPSRTLREMSTAVRDTMSYDELKRARSKKSTLYRLMVTLDELAATRHPLNQLPLVKKVGRLAESYRFKHRGGTSEVERTRIDLMVEIDRLASAQVLRTYAELQYAERLGGTDLQKHELQAMPAQKGSKGGQTRPPVRQFAHLTGGADIRGHDTSWGARPDDERFVQDASASDNQKAPNARLATAAAGLSHAEVLAIRTYTAENYRYINPSMTGFEPGLRKHLGVRADDESVDRLQQESAVHAGMAMSGLAKLPAWHGVSYRGDNVDLGRMKRMYTVGQVATNELFMSTSKGTATGRQFLRTSGDGPIKLFVEVEVDGSGGKDISMLSTATTEREVLVLPGARYVTLSIEEYDVATFARTPLRQRPDGRKRPDGSIPAYYVRIRQVG